MQPKIIPAKNIVVENLSNSIQISKHNNSSIQENISEILTNGAFTGFSSQNPYYNLVSQNIEFNIPTSYDAIKLKNSYLDIKAKVMAKFNEPGKYFMQNGYWYFVPLAYSTRICATNVGTVRVRRRTLLNKYDYTKKKCIALAPLNSCFLLDESTLKYGNVSEKQQLIFRQMTNNQSHISSRAQDENFPTWYDGEKEYNVIECNPYVQTLKTQTAPGLIDYADQAFIVTAITDAATVAVGIAESDVLVWENSTTSRGKLYVAAADGDAQGAEVVFGNVHNLHLLKVTNNGANVYYVEKYLDFFVPFNMLNQVFDTDIYFYLNALKDTQVKLQLKLVPWVFSDALGVTTKTGPLTLNPTWAAGLYSAAETVDATSGALPFIDKLNSGIVEIKMVTDSKSNQNFKSDIESVGDFVQIYNKTETQILSTQRGAKVSVQEEIVAGHTSIKNVILQFTVDSSTTEIDSCYRKQRSSLLNTLQLINVQNGVWGYSKTGQMNYLRNFLIWQSKKNDYFVQPLNNLTQLYWIATGAENRIGEYHNNGADSSDRLYDWMTTYGFKINLEAFSMDNGQDTVYDGVNTANGQKLKVSFEIGTYDDTKNESVQYSADIQYPKNCIGVDGEGTYNLWAFQDYDSSLQISKEGKMSINENLIQ